VTSDHVTRTVVLLEHAAELARRLIRSPRPPGGEASQFLHAKKRLSAPERRVVSAVAFTLLRNLLLARDISDREPMPTPAQAAAALLLGCSDGSLSPDALFPEVFAARSLAALPEEEVATLPSRAVEAFPGPESSATLARVHELDALLSEDAGANAAVYHDALSLRTSMPGPLLDAIAANPDISGRPRLHALLYALLLPADAYVRIRTSSRAIEETIAELHGAGIDCTRSTMFPSALRLTERQNVTDTAPYQRGDIEVQDAGSQVLGAAAWNPAARHILDACAGAGGKTLQLADMHRDVPIVACDIEAAKLRSLRQRAARAGSLRIATHTVRPGRDPFERRPELVPSGGFDTVLVDAPCAGTGTLRRNPGLKYRLALRTVARLAARQYDILAANAAYCAAGGVLVYSTCSLLHIENQEVVTRFLTGHPEFEADPLDPVFEAQGIEVRTRTAGTTHLTLTPSEHGTDGFFVARMRRKA
jgi:16S rRNA (cytosine967-C5)-methyltransferase